jgi:hypothetical protein
MGRRKEKLRRLNWDKVPDTKVEGTIFADIHSSGSGSTTVTTRPNGKRKGFLALRKSRNSAARKSDAGELLYTSGSGSGEVEIDIDALTDLFALKSSSSTVGGSSSASKKPGSCSSSITTSCT